MKHIQISKKKRITLVCVVVMLAIFLDIALYLRSSDIVLPASGNIISLPDTAIVIDSGNDYDGVNVKFQETEDCSIWIAPTRYIVNKEQLVGLFVDRFLSSSVYKDTANIDLNQIDSPYIGNLTSMTEVKMLEFTLSKRNVGSALVIERLSGLEVLAMTSGEHTGSSSKDCADAALYCCKDYQIGWYRRLVYVKFTILSMIASLIYFGKAARQRH